MSSLFVLPKKLEIHVLGCDLYNLLAPDSIDLVSIPVSCYLLKNELSAKATPFNPFTNSLLEQQMPFYSEYWEHSLNQPCYYDPFIIQYPDYPQYPQYPQHESAAYYCKF